MAIVWGRKTWTLPNVSSGERERVKYETWVGAWGSLQRCLLFWFVSFWFCFNVFVCLFVFLLRGHWQFTNTLVFPGVQRSRRKAATKTMENVGERVGKNASILKNKCNNNWKMNFLLVLLFRTLGSNSVILFCWTLSVLRSRPRHGLS